MAADVLHRAPLFVSDHRVLLVSDAQAVPRPMAPGGTEANRSSGMPAQPFQAGRGLILTAPARPDSLAEVTQAEVPRRPARSERARLHVVLGTGPVDYALAGRLAGLGLAVRAVSRHRPPGPADKIGWRAADAQDPDAAGDAAMGSAVLDQCLNAPYTQRPQRFPPRSGVRAATEHAGALLESLENVYGHGPADGRPMTEDLPPPAATVKGRTRAAMTRELLAAAASSVTPAEARTGGTVTGAPCRWLRLEAAVLLAGSLIAFSATGQPWWLVPLTILVPDLSAAGYLGGTRLGAHLYNLAHSTILPAALAGAGWWQGRPLVLALGLVWLAHIGTGRLLGYGLKYGDNFRHTHLGQLGRPGGTP